MYTFDLRTFSDNDIQLLARKYRLDPVKMNIHHELAIRIASPYIKHQRAAFPANMKFQDIHVIWIGSAIPAKYLKNIKTWFEIFKPSNIYLWYDSKNPLFKPGDPLRKQSAGGIKLRNINDYAFFNPAHYELPLQIVQKLENIYNIESGKTDRVVGGVTFGKSTNEMIINFGLATDILRLLVLYTYPGLYLDTDTTIDDHYTSDDLRICNSGFCFAWQHPSKAFIGGLGNNIIYYNGTPEAKHLLERYLNNIVKHEEFNIGYDSIDLCRYITDPGYWQQQTIQTSGPQAIPATIPRSEPSATLKLYTRLAKEAEENAEHWQRKADTYDVAQYLHRKEILTIKLQRLVGKDDADEIKELEARLDMTLDQVVAEYRV
ncbi:hypothetical protein LCGC14_2880350, partial [marine sediment metagenome]